ncbi:hypothetical protein ACJX0J_016665, partial [Zea mays]
KINVTIAKDLMCFQLTDCEIPIENLYTNAKISQKRETMSLLHMHNAKEEHKLLIVIFILANKKIQALIYKASYKQILVHEMYKMDIICTMHKIGSRFLDEIKLEVFREIKISAVTLFLYLLIISYGNYIHVLTIIDSMFYFSIEMFYKKVVVGVETQIKIHQIKKDHAFLCFLAF